MRLVLITCVLSMSTVIYTHVYELLEPVDTICTQPRYELVCDGFVYIWTKCDVLRAITTNDRDRQAFSQLIVADVIHVANNMLHLIKHDGNISYGQMQHLHALADHLAKAYADAFAESDSSSIQCTQKVLDVLKEMSDVSREDTFSEQT